MALLSVSILAALGAGCGGPGGDDLWKAGAGGGPGACTGGAQIGQDPDALEGCLSAEDCNDGDLCTLDICDHGLCASAPVSCDDHDACTADSCDAVAGCLHASLDVDDGDACTADACDPLLGITHKKVSCDDGDLCTTDTCDAAAGCVHTPIAALSDEDACTEDTCDPLTGAVTHAQKPGCCPHSTCVAGAPLNLACSYAGLHNNCAAKVCAYDSFCCDVGWDSTCVAHTRDPAICPTGIIPSFFSCGCGHSYCEAGAPLSRACDPCVKKICEADSYCCDNVWDANCVGEVSALCDVPSDADCK